MGFELQGVIIQEIMRRTNCKIVINQDFPDGQPRKIIFNGLPTQIKQAKELVSAVISEGATALQAGASGSSEATETMEMDCPADKVGLVIGAKGVVIQDVMRKTGCKVVVNQDYPEGHPRKVLFTGRMPQIAEARNMVYAIINKGPAVTGNSTDGSSGTIVAKEMDCPQEKVGLVIGAKGVIIQEMMRRTGCKMVVNQDFPEGQPRKIVFTGTQEQIDEAMDLASKVMAQGPAALHSSGPNVVTQDLNIVQAQVGKIIGPGGITIKNLQQTCGVKMVIEQEFPESDERKVRISGDADRVRTAVLAVCQLLEHGTTNLPGITLSSAAAYGSQNSQNYYSGGVVAGALALGADGQAGQLLPITVLPNGMSQQVRVNLVVHVIPF